MKKVLILTFTSIVLLAFVVKTCNASNNDEYDEKTPLVGNIEKCQRIELSADSVIINYLGFKVFYKAKKLSIHLRFLDIILQTLICPYLKHQIMITRVRGGQEDIWQSVRI